MCVVWELDVCLLERCLRVGCLFVKAMSVIPKGDVLCLVCVGVGGWGVCAWNTKMWCPMFGVREGCMEHQNVMSCVWCEKGDVCDTKRLRTSYMLCYSGSWHWQHHRSECAERGRRRQGGVWVYCHRLVQFIYLVFLSLSVSLFCHFRSLYISVPVSLSVYFFWVPPLSLESCMSESVSSS